MLAKIHLKTSCGCTKTFFQRTDTVYPAYIVPIKTRSVVTVFGRLYSTYAKRTFGFVKWEFKSKNRVELWYEENYEDT